jgi:hypothetical protein
MTEKTELDEATNELRKVEQRFSNYWNQTSDLNKILFNIEMDKIYKSFRVKCAQLRIEDKINSLNLAQKQSLNSHVVYAVVYGIFLIIYNIFFEKNNDGVNVYLLIAGGLVLNFVLSTSGFNQHKNMLMISAHMFDPISDYELAPGPTKRRYGSLKDRFMITRGHLLFNYIKGDFVDNDIEQIQTDTEIVKCRINILHIIEGDMSDSKYLEWGTESHISAL